MDSSSAEPKRRRRRWDDQEENDPSAPSDRAAANDTSNTVEKADATNSVVGSTSVSDNTVADEGAKKARKSRFGAAPAPTNGLQNSQINLMSQEAIQQMVVLKLQLQQLTEKLQTVAQDAARIEQNPNRSPSPPPKYDSNGKRTNTREIRMRAAFTQQKTSIIEKLIKIDPMFQPPPDYVRTKPFKKVYIPTKLNPEYNFIGLIIGPRGQTQRRMEQETSCKISIRGKGSQKEGSRGRSMTTDDDDELHVHISGESQENVDKAVKLVEDLLDPNDAEVEQHKQNQLRQLALINGTLREDEYCPICGEKGHRQWECPHRAKSFKAAGIKCAICGDMSHPTRDCPMKQAEVQPNDGALDVEYDSFMAELTGEKPKTTLASNNGSTSTIAASNGVAPKLVAPTLQDSAPRTTIVAPIVDIMGAASRRKPQTIINVTTVMTGSAPPSFLSSNTDPQTAYSMSSNGQPYNMPAPGYPPYYHQSQQYPPVDPTSMLHHGQQQHWPTASALPMPPPPPSNSGPFPPPLPHQPAPPPPANSSNKNQFYYQYPT